MSTAFKYRPQFAVDLSFIVEPDGVQYHAYCPQLKGLHIGGDSEAEALERAANAAKLYLRSLDQYGQFFDDVRVEIPEGAVLHTMTLEWPSPHTSGNS